MSNLAGEQIGLLKVLELTSKHNRRHWLCICTCGKQTCVRESTLIHRKVTSCGCVRTKRVKGIINCKQPGESANNTHRTQYITGARSRGLSFDLTRAEFRAITSCDCHYCGSPPVLLKRQGFDGNHKANGVDRKSSADGYNVANCVACCWRCNKAKGNMGYDEFLSFCKLVSSRFGVV